MAKMAFLVVLSNGEDTDVKIIDPDWWGKIQEPPRKYQTSSTADNDVALEADALNPIETQSSILKAIDWAQENDYQISDEFIGSIY